MSYFTSDLILNTYSNIIDAVLVGLIVEKQLIFLIKTHISVSCGTKNLGCGIDKCVFYRYKKNAVFTHLYFNTP